jgi:hypothetical protein
VITQIEILDFNCGKCEKRADYAVTSKSKHGERMDHYCKEHVPQEVLDRIKWMCEP